MESAETNHYVTLGLDRRCTDAQIKTAYRLLARQHHPDVNCGAPAAVAQTQRLNAAHEILSDPERRRAYDAELAARTPRPTRRTGRIERSVTQEANLRLEDFFRGVTFEVRVNDPANPDGPETYPLVVPPATAPGTRFRLPRAGAFSGGFVLVRVKAHASFRFKVRGSDLRCDLRVKPERALQGGAEMISGALGSLVRVPIPRHAARGEIIRIPGEGLPKSKGGRGDLLVRLTYRPEVRVTRLSGR